ncbi:MAG: DinB family protein [Paludibaculum sp.]
MTLDVEIMADQIRRAFRGPSWHGPSVLEVLAGISAEDAAARPIPDAHSILEIVLHMTAGYRLVLRRIRGEQAQYSLEEGWPPAPALSSEAWLEIQRTLEELNQQLQSAVRTFPSERLSQGLGSEYSAYTQFCGSTPA